MIAAVVSIPCLRPCLSLLAEFATLALGSASAIIAIESNGRVLGVVAATLIGSTLLGLCPGWRLPDLPGSAARVHRNHAS